MLSEKQNKVLGSGDAPPQSNETTIVINYRGEVRVHLRDRRTN
jgi:hypothetical protein